PVQLEQLADLLPAAAHAAQVRGGIQAVFLAQPLHGLRRVRQGRPAGAERAGDILRRLRAQLRRGPVEERALLVGLGRVELEGNGNRESGAGSRCSGHFWISFAILVFVAMSALSMAAKRCISACRSAMSAVNPRSRAIQSCVSTSISEPRAIRK